MLRQEMGYPLHEIAKLEQKYKFLYFLRDIGIASAQGPAIFTWTEYVSIQGALTLGESCSRQ